MYAEPSGAISRAQRPKRGYAINETPRRKRAREKVAMAKRWTWLAAVGSGGGGDCSYGDAIAVGVEMGSRGDVECGGIAFTCGSQSIRRCRVKMLEMEMEMEMEWQWESLE
jgi:hypothetical protein